MFHQINISYCHLQHKIQKDKTHTGQSHSLQSKILHNLKVSLLPLQFSYYKEKISITNCNLTLCKHCDKSLFTRTQTLIYDPLDGPAGVFTVNGTSPKCTPQRTLQALFSSTLPGDCVRMQQRYELLELPLNETYQHHQSQQHRLSVVLCHDWKNSGRVRMKLATQQKRRAQQRVFFTLCCQNIDISGSE